jgi:hypothetical protein
MRSVSALTVAVIIGASAATAACGQQRPALAASGTAASSPPAASPSATGSAASPQSAAAACGAASAVLGPGRTLTLTQTDSTRSFCVKRGTGVLIYLRGTAIDRWGPLKSSSAVLVPSANGHLSLAVGVTGGYFVAALPGSAVITSARSRCGPAVPPSAPTMSGKASCGSIELFRVTIRVA